MSNSWPITSLQIEKSDFTYSLHITHLFRRLLRSGCLTSILCLVYGVGMAVAAPGFASWNNAANVLDAMLPLMVVATGQTIVLMTAGIDLSVTSIIALTSVLGARIVTDDQGWLAGHALATPAAVVVMLATGSILGAINGLCIAHLKMPPFMVTLTTMMSLSGLAIWLTSSQSIDGLPQSFLVIGKNPWIAVATTVGACVIAQMMLKRTVFGMQLGFVGSNPATSRVSGVNVERITLLAYLTCGLYAALASILITAQLETGSPVQWENNLLDVIGAAVIGGTSLYGGRGSVWWTLGGVVLLSMIDNSLNLLNLSHFTIMIAKGSVILLAAMLDTLRRRMEER